MIDTILFDLDGTLIDTNELIIKTFEHVFENHLTQFKLSRTDYIKFIGPTLKESFLRYTNDLVEVDYLVAAYRKKSLEIHDDFAVAFEGAYELLSDLEQKGYQLGIVSSKMSEMVKRGLLVSGLDKFFKVIIGSDDVINHKPDKEPIEKALSCFLNVKGAIYVGDHPNDIYAGKNARIKTCGVSFSLHKESLVSANADYYIDTLLELKEVLKHV
ncbi:MAG TPA: pyrophosphatase PpaX [Acholeplasma sp.]|nr:pyrophosphatase PpaX [Acholeplasma sp.]